jgi:hypothetical protein
MVNNRLLLGSVAFGMGLAISLVTSRDFGKAMGTGIIAVPAALVATGIVNRRQRQQGESRLAALAAHIRVLQQRRLEEYEAFLDMSTERQRLEASLYMQPGPGPYGQTVPSLAAAPTALAQIGPAAESAQIMAVMATRKPALSWDLSTPVPAIPTLDLSPHTLPTQIQDPPRREPDDLNQFLADKKSAKRKIEAKLNELQAEYAQVQVHLKEERIALDQLTQALKPLKQQKQTLESEVAALQQEIEALQQSHEVLQQQTQHAATLKAEFDAGTHPLQVKLQQLQTTIADRQATLADLERQLRDRDRSQGQTRAPISPTDRPGTPLTMPAIAVPPHAASTPPQRMVKDRTGDRMVTAPRTAVLSHATPSSATPTSTVSNGTAAEITAAKSPLYSGRTVSEFPEEWTVLMGQLPEYEFQVLKAIAEQSNPAPVIKQIAEANLTMPELLIDGINERALDTIGDLILASTENSVAIAPEHRKLVTKLIQAYEF